MSVKFEMTNMDMKLGKTLKLKGKIADNVDGFAVNLGQGADELALHFNPRFNESTIVCNSRDSGNWGQEQRDNHMCFGQGAEVKLSVTFQADEFKVTLPDGYELTFPNRLGHSHLSYLCVRGLHISSFKVD
ncbi:galectin-2 [Fukomys damarensis]|uniref:Galectin n=1 Tax=Fukomys damarensis TaxID=885580 RepID=A0A091EMA1_FUKDA|nr:galectin-2 [Fukomys damarensis]KFO36701.1 Galectin-2 [Fukomys damarensis]